MQFSSLLPLQFLVAPSGWSNKPFTEQRLLPYADPGILWWILSYLQQLPSDSSSGVFYLQRLDTWRPVLSSRIDMKHFHCARLPMRQLVRQAWNVISAVRTRICTGMCVCVKMCVQAICKCYWCRGLAFSSQHKTRAWIRSHYITALLRLCLMKLKNCV